MFPCPMVIGFCSSGSESPSPLVMRHCLLGDREIYPLDSFEYHEHGRDKKKKLNKSMSHPTTKAMLGVRWERLNNVMEVTNMVSNKKKWE